MSIKSLTLILLIIQPLCYCQAQTDSVITQLQNIPIKYLQATQKKVNQYSNRITGKTEKTLVKLSRWEHKIHTSLLKASPETANRLFAPGQPTFTSLLEKLKQGEAIEQGYKAQYNAYRDKLTISMKYVQEQKMLLENKLKKIEKVNKELSTVDSVVADSESVEKFIRERKRQLIQQSLQYIGKSKYLKKINKEAYYYTEALRNYKEIFSDPKKVEEAALKLLSKIPGFEKFTQQNSQLTGLFVSPSSFPAIPAGTSVPIVNGIPTRGAMQQYMQVNLPTMANANISQFLQGNVSNLKAELDKIKGYASGGNMNNDGLPDFKPNSQKSKPFSKRLEYVTDIQFGKSNTIIPASLRTALGIGYKFTDKNSAGIAVSYVLGMGKGWDSIRFSHQGLGFRTYIKTKLKKGFAIQGGSEWNYNFDMAKFNGQPAPDKWQQNALLGMSKSMSVGKKAKSNIQLYYDFLHNKQIPVSQPFVFRYGYSFGGG